MGGGWGGGGVGVGRGILRGCDGSAGVVERGPGIEEDKMVGCLDAVDDVGLFGWFGLVFPL